MMAENYTVHFMFNTFLQPNKEMNGIRTYGCKHHFGFTRRCLQFPGEIIYIHEVYRMLLYQSPALVL